MGDVGVDGDRRMVTLSYSIGRYRYSRFETVPAGLVSFHLDPAGTSAICAIVTLERSLRVSYVYT